VDFGRQSAAGSTDRLLAVSFAPRRSLFAVLTLIASCAACSLATARWLDPSRKLNETQAGGMHEYLAAFCVKDDRHDKQFIIGTMAAMSRIVTRANLGNLAFSRIPQVQGHPLDQIVIFVSAAWCRCTD
jgi:hypothetical protein